MMGGQRALQWRVASTPGTDTPEYSRSIDSVRPGEAFRSERASRATSGAEGRLRVLIGERLDLDLTLTAVRVRTPFFGRLEVWPDIVLAEFAIAIELDTVGRNGDEHVGRREHSDRRKDQLLAAVGWHVVRVRCRPLRALGPHDLIVTGISASVADAVIERAGEVRGHLIVRSYAR
jgi:very-short-patch-repair endonuclease